MDDPFVAILFIEDLIDFVFYQHGLEFENEVSMRNFRYSVIKTRFNSVIGHYVLEVMDAEVSAIRSCYDALVQRGVMDIDAFRYECMISTVFHFPHGYNHERYLNLCAMFIGLSVLYYKAGKRDIVNGASHVLTYVLNFYIYQLDFNVRTDYFKLAVVAQTLRRDLVKEVADTNSKNSEKGREVMDSDQSPDLFCSS